MDRGNKAKVVPESKHALDILKYEIAAELGLPVGKSSPHPLDIHAEFASELGSYPASGMSKDYWGHISSRDAGAVGGTITQRLIRQAEETLFSIK
ncbi:MAG: alpha/beta-type small acid-soluble spore protein [Paenibacillaceae bacterium]